MSEELALLEKINQTIDSRLVTIEVEMKELKAAGGRITGGLMQKKTLGGILSAAIKQNKDNFFDFESKGNFKPIPIETKTVDIITSANLTGGNYVNTLPWQPGMEPIGQFRFRDLVPSYPSDIDFVNYPRAKTPIGEGSFSRQASEGATKAQVDRDYEMTSLTLKPMSGFTIVSRQSLRNIPFLQNWLPTTLMESLLDSEDIDFSTTLVAAATGSTATTRTLVIEKLVSFIKTLKKTKYRPNGIAVDPDVWEEIVLTRPGVAGESYSTPPVATIDANGNVRIVGVPIYPVNWLTGRRVIVGDWNKAGIITSENLTLRQSDSHASLFVANEIAFLLERTEGLAIFRPSAFISTTV